MPGARNAVVCCLRIQPHEKVTLITDDACLEIGAALAARAGRPRPAATTPSCSKTSPRGRSPTCPRAVLDDMETSDVSIFAVQGAAERIAHAHADDRRGQPPQACATPTWSISIAASCWKACAPISTRWTASARRSGSMASQAREIRATNPAGTDIVARFSPELEVAEDQRHHQPE